MTKANIIKMFWQGRFKKGLWVIALLSLSTIIALPYAVRHGINSYLLDNGAKRVDISTLGINLFTGKAHIEGISIEDDKRPLLTSDNFSVDLSLISIFKKEISIETAYCENLLLRIKQLADGNWQIASISTANDQDNIENTIDESNALKDDAKWIFGAKEFVLKDCIVELETEKFSTKIEIEKAELHNFATLDSSTPADFYFLGKIDGAVVELNLNQISLENMLVAGNIKIEKFPLKNISAFLADILTLKSGALSIDGHFNIDMAKLLQVKYKGIIVTDNIDLTVASDNFKVNSLLWNGTADYSPDSKHFLTGLTGKSELLIGGLAVNLRQDSLVELGAIKVQIGDIILGKKDATIGSIKLVKSNFQLLSSENSMNLEIPEVNGSGLKTDGVSGALKNINITGAKLKTSNNNEPINLNIGKIKIKNTLASKKNSSIENILITGAKIKYVANSMPLDITLSKANILGLVNSEIGNNIRAIKLIDTSVYSPLREIMITKLASFNINELSVTENYDLAILNSQMKDWDIFPDSEGNGHSGKLATVELDKFSLTQESGLSLKKVLLTEMDLWLVRDKSGSFNWGKKIASLSNQKLDVKNGESGRDVKQKSEVSGSTLPFNITEFALTGKSTINYQDYTLIVPFKSSSTITKLILENISSKKNKGTITLEGLLEQRAPINLFGNFNGIASKNKDSKNSTFIDLKYKLRNYPIRNLSPYAVQNVGSALDSGRMKIEGNFKLDEGIVDSENELFFNKLETKSIDPELAKKVDDKLPIPLGAALSLLRDSEDNIQLDMPISGPIGELNFDATDAIITALGKAVVPAASSYLVYMLGPYAALAYVGLKVGENLLEVSLPPVDFAPQQIELTVDNKTYLERVGLLLVDGKTTADLQICPIIVLTHEFGEESKIEEELSAEELTEIDQLGQSRAENIRTYLKEEYKVDPNRLLLCITKIQKDKTSKVVLHLDNE